MKRFLSQSGLSLKQWVILAVLIICIIWSGSGIYTLYLRYSQSKNDYQQSQAELQALQDRKSELEADLRHLETNRGIEGELRTRFNASKEGEELVVIVSNKNAGTSTEEIKEVSSWWRKVTDWFR